MNKIAQVALKFLKQANEETDVFFFNYYPDIIIDYHRDSEENNGDDGWTHDSAPSLSLKEKCKHVFELLSDLNDPVDHAGLTINIKSRDKKKKKPYHSDSLSSLHDFNSVEELYSKSLEAIRHFFGDNFDPNKGKRQ